MLIERCSFLLFPPFLYLRINKFRDASDCVIMVPVFNDLLQQDSSVFWVEQRDGQFLDSLKEKSNMKHYSYNLA